MKKTNKTQTSKNKSKKAVSKKPAKKPATKKTTTKKVTTAKKGTKKQTPKKKKSSRPQISQNVSINKDIKIDNNKDELIEEPIKKNKNVPWGRTLSTNDKYLGKQKNNSDKTRPVVVIANNEDNELAVVPLSSRKGNNRTLLENYGKNNKRDNKKETYYKHYIEIEDNEGNPIIINDKFRENHKNMDISKEDVDEIRKTLLTKAKTLQRNIKMLDKLYKKDK